MAFWKKKEPPRHVTLVGKDPVDEVAEALANGLGVKNLQIFNQMENEASDHILSCLRTVCSQSAGQGEAVVIIGDTPYYETVCADLQTPNVPVVFWQTSFAYATRLLPKGTPLPYLSVYDVGFYDPTTQDFQEGLVNLLGLGICCDAGLFDMVYSSFSLEKLLRRATDLLRDIGEAEETGSTIREHLSFGQTLATPLFSLAKGELTYGEALAIGMLWEAKCGVRAGRVPLRLLHDLDGAISYYGLPRAYEVSMEDIKAYFLSLYAPTDPVPLALPRKKGTSALFTPDCTTLLSLAEATK